MNSRIIVLVLVVLTIIGSIVYLESQRVDTNGDGTAQIVQSDSSPEEIVVQKEQRFDRAKEITTPDGFINTDGITIDELIGKKVILIDFWTYSCINCQRTTPYLNAWYEKYRDQGLEIIGIHTPEFEFEKDYDNVVQAVEQFGIKFPVVMDNDYSTWRAYQNRYWPRKYLIDIDGFIVYDHIGEGGYEETEEMIQAALLERAARLNESADLSGMVDVEVEVSQAQSPEVYFGGLRNELLANGTQGQVGVQELSAPETVSANMLYLDGTWDIRSEYAENQSGNSVIVFPYNAQKVFMVASSEASLKVQVLLDGEPVGNLAGADVDADGYVTIQEEQLYRLVEEDEPNQHILELRVENPGLQAFTFTFG